MADDLPPFDRKSPCPKCGGKLLSFRWAKADEAKGIPERMVRDCQECSYSFAEKPLDIAIAEAKP